MHTVLGGKTSRYFWILYRNVVLRNAINGSFLLLSVYRKLNKEYSSDQFIPKQTVLLFPCPLSSARLVVGGGELLMFNRT